MNLTLLPWRSSTAGPGYYNTPQCVVNFFNFSMNMSFGTAVDKLRHCLLRHGIVYWGAPQLAMQHRNLSHFRRSPLKHLVCCKTIQAWHVLFEHCTEKNKTLFCAIFCCLLRTNYWKYISRYEWMNESIFLFSTVTIVNEKTFEWLIQCRLGIEYHLVIIESIWL